MTPEEKRAKQAEYMRKWRAANPEKANEAARRHMAKWRAENPEESRTYVQKWRAEHPDSVQATYARQLERLQRLRATDSEWRDEQNVKTRARWKKWKGVPEVELQARFQSENPAAVSMDRIRPDFYIPGDGFVEIKRALPYKAYNWRVQSVHFPGLYFMYIGNGRLLANVDAQFDAEPRPLLVIVYHVLTGQELSRKSLQ